MMNNKNTTLMKRWAYFLLLATTFYPAALWNASCVDDKGPTKEDPSVAEEYGVVAETAICVGSVSETCLNGSGDGEIYNCDTSVSTIADALVARRDTYASESNVTILISGSYSEVVTLNESGFSGTVIMGCDSTDTISYPSTPSDVTGHTVSMDSTISSFTFNNLTINGIGTESSSLDKTNDTNNSMAATISIDGSTGVRFSGVTVDDNYTASVRIDGGAGVTFENVTFTNFTTGTGAYESSVAIWNAGAGSVIMSGTDPHNDSTLDVLFVGEEIGNTLDMTGTVVTQANLGAVVMWNSLSTNMDTISFDNGGIGVFTANPSNFTLERSTIAIPTFGVVGCQDSNGDGNPGSYNMKFADNTSDIVYGDAAYEVDAVLKNLYFGSVTITPDSTGNIYQGVSGPVTTAYPYYAIYNINENGTDFSAGSDFAEIIADSSIAAQYRYDVEGSAVPCDLAEWH